MPNVGVRMLGSAGNPETAVLERLQGAHKVGNAGDGHVEGGAGTRLVHAHGDLGGALGGNDDAVGAHDLGRTDDGAEVALVGDVVEHKHERVALLGTRIGDVHDVGVAVGRDLAHDALMRTVAAAVGRHAVELGLLHDLDGHVGTAQLCAHALKRRVGPAGSPLLLTAAPGLLLAALCLLAARARVLGLLFGLLGRCLDKYLADRDAGLERLFDRAAALDVVSHVASCWLWS